jgi:hypothetical protein
LIVGALKIKQEDMAILRAAIEAELAKPVNAWAAQRYKEANRSHMRFRWDVLYASKLKIGDGVGSKGDVDLYAYMNDDHIDSALQAIMGKDYAPA